MGMQKTATSPSSHSAQIKLNSISHYPTPGITLTLPVVSVLLRKRGFSAERLGENHVRVGFQAKGDLDVSPVQEVRDDFLQVKSIEDAVRFLDRYGALYSSQSGPREYSLERIHDLQSKIRSDRELPAKTFFVHSSLEEMLERFPPMSKLLPGRVPFLCIEVWDIHAALRSANYLDQIAGIRAATCPVCKNQFKLPLRKKKTYCGDVCQRKAGKARWSANKGGQHAKAAK